MPDVHLLDTYACIRLLNGSSPALSARMATHDPAAFRISAVVRAELIFGARRSDRVDANLRLLTRFLSTFRSLPFDDFCAEHYGLIRAELEREGRPIGPNDQMIAATARAHDLVLVTHDVREFTRVVGLRVVDREA